MRRAILLGSVRKSMSLLDRPGEEPARSLRYFAGPLDEVRTKSFPVSHWRHLEFNLAPLRAGVLGPDCRSRPRYPSRFGTGKPDLQEPGGPIRNSSGGPGGDGTMMSWYRGILTLAGSSKE